MSAVCVVASGARRCTGVTLVAYVALRGAEALLVAQDQNLVRSFCRTVSESKGNMVSCNLMLSGCTQGVCELRYTVLVGTEKGNKKGFCTWQKAFGETTPPLILHHTCHLRT